MTKGGTPCTLMPAGTQVGFSISFSSWSIRFYFFPSLSTLSSCMFFFALYHLFSLFPLSSHFVSLLHILSISFFISTCLLSLITFYLLSPLPRLSNPLSFASFFCLLFIFYVLFFYLLFSYFSFPTFFYFTSPLFPLSLSFSHNSPSFRFSSPSLPLFPLLSFSFSFPFYPFRLLILNRS